MLTVRYCRRCQAMTDHIEDPPRRLRWRWALFWPLLWLLDLVLDPPMCLRCLDLDDDLGYDDLGYDDLGDDLD